MCLYLFDCCLTITPCNDTLHLLHLDRFIKANPSSISIFLMKLKRLDLPQLKLDCLDCQKSDIRRNSPCSSLLLWTSFCFLQVNQQKWFLLITYHTLNRSTNLSSRNHPTLCFWLRGEGWQMPNAEQLCYQTEKSSHQRFSIKMLFLKVLQYSWENNWNF